MRERSLEARLRSDAPAWRDALASGIAPHAARPERDRFRFPTSLALGAAAMLAMAAFVAMQLPEPRESQPRPIATTPLLGPEMVARWTPRVDVPAPPLQLTTAEEVATAPIRAEADRLRADVTDAVTFVLTLVPAATVASETGA